MAGIVDGLRAFGLDILNITRRSWRPNVPEAPKKVLDQTLKAALSQNPVFLAIIQVAAKIQELLCVSSLTAIVLQAVRRELLDEGLPIGLLGSGISFSQISFLWTADFLVAARWSTTSWRTAQLYGLIILASGLAVFIGPAAALLFLPRAQNVVAGTAMCSLSGGVENFWADSVSPDSEPELCRCSNSTLYWICPGGGHNTPKQTLTTFDYTDYDANTGMENAYDP
ncbi:hypothetical protein LTR95_003401 [Oleoguttula sp. CCFEE 5521]